MIKIDMSDKVVLITGGTKGIGLATALKFGEAGAKCYLTYRWGEDDFTFLYDAFKAKNAPEPILIQADVAIAEDTDVLLEEIKKNHDKIDIFISNVAFAQKVNSLDEYKMKYLFKSIEYSAWPVISYTQKIKKVFGRYPKYILGVSSDGGDHYYSGYDFVAASKTVLEFFIKYMSVRLFEEGSSVNVLRFGPVKTESFSFIFGEEFFKYLKDNNLPENFVMKTEECADAMFAMCSGLLDSINGQIVTIDKGFPFQDNLMMRYISDKENK